MTATQRRITACITWYTDLFHVNKTFSHKKVDHVLQADVSCDVLCCLGILSLQDNHKISGFSVYLEELVPLTSKHRDNRG